MASVVIPAPGASRRDWYDSLVSPRRVAVIGASADPAKGSIIRYLVRFGFSGDIIPVNPRVSSIDGLPAVSNVTQAEGDIDLAIISIPAAHVPAAIRQCAEKRIPAVCVMSSGFGELNETGADLERQLRTEACEGGVRVFGPNTNGFFSARSKLVASIMSPLDDIDVPMPDDGIAVVTQSGALGAFILKGLADAGLGVGSYFATGNAIDIGFEEIAARLVDDPNTRIIIAYVEGLRDGKAFVELARRARALHKPILMLKVGVTEEGAKTSASHTGALAGVNSVYSGVLQQLGVRRAASLRQMIGAGRLLCLSDAANRRRVGIISISGGLAVISSDELIQRGLSVPSWSAETSAALAKVLPSYLGVRNPLDAGVAIADRSVLEAVLRAADDDSRTDITLLCLGGNAERGKQVVKNLIEIAPSLATPPILVWIGSVDQESEKALAGAGVACFDFAESAIEALDLAVGQAATLVEETASSAGGRNGAYEEARRIIDAARGEGRKALDEGESRKILSCFGIPTVPESDLFDADPTRIRVDKLRYPTVAKLRSSMVLHKTEIGGVIMGLHDGEAARRAAVQLKEVAKRTGIDNPKVVFQDQIQVGLEFIIGFSKDEIFGGVVTFGMGGIAAEVVKDTQTFLPSTSRAEIFMMFDRLRCRKMLDGFRGASPVSRDELADVILAFCKMVGELDDVIDAVDINPVASTRHDGRLVALDAAIILSN